MILEIDLPKDSKLISKDMKDIIFSDCFLVTDIDSNLSILDIYYKITQRLSKLNFLFKIRDKIFGLFGVRALNGFLGKRIVRDSNKIDFFNIEEYSDNSLILTNKDSHLDVMINLEIKNKNNLYLITSVKTHNIVGYFYIKLVAIFHKKIVRFGLKSLI